uniref:Putative conserved secreted protein n=1 Tax=Lutzomyia longipalpis TaxID=7200 RepID=A0A1B0ESP1_LUTLO
MNFFLRLIVGSVLLGSVALAQNPLQDAYYIIHSYHRMYEGTKDNVRFYMADTSRNILDDCMEIVASEIESWSNRVATCKNWSPRNTEAIGNALRDCAMQASQTVYNIHNNVYDELEAMQEESVQLQFAVVRHLRNFNILEDYADFVEDFQSVVNVAYDRLEHHFVPRLEDALEPILEAESTLPQQTQTCVNAISRKFRSLC